MLYLLKNICYSSSGALNYTEPFFDVQPSLHHFRAPFPPIVPAINRYSYPRHVLNPPSHYRLPRNPLRVPIPDNASHYWGTYSGIPGQNASPAYMYPQLRQSSNFMQESGQRNAVYYSGLLPCQPRLLHPNTCRPHAIPIVVPEDKV